MENLQPRRVRLGASVGHRAPTARRLRAAPSFPLIMELAAEVVGALG
jgi:hypothetical protein